MNQNFKNNKPKILLVGGGGHCRSVIDVIEKEGKFEIYGIIDVKEKVGQEVLGYKIIGTDEDLPFLKKDCHYALVTVGQIRDYSLRESLFYFLKKIGFKLPTIISPLAYVSSRAKIGEGTVVMHYAIVNAGASIGKNCIINTRALIEHDCIVEDHCHISTGAILNGGVVVRHYSFIWSGAICKEYIEIPEKSFIKAGTLVK